MDPCVEQWGKLIRNSKLCLVLHLRAERIAVVEAEFILVLQQDTAQWYITNNRWRHFGAAIAAGLIVQYGAVHGEVIAIVRDIRERLRALAKTVLATQVTRSNARRSASNVESVVHHEAATRKALAMEENRHRMERHRARKRANVTMQPSHESTC